MRALGTTVIHYHVANSWYRGGRPMRLTSALVCFDEPEEGWNVNLSEVHCRSNSSLIFAGLPVLKTNKIH